MGLFEIRTQRKALERFLDLFGDDLTKCQAVLMAEIVKANANAQAHLYDLQEIGNGDRNG